MIEIEILAIFSKEFNLIVHQVKKGYTQEAALVPK
jgi:hypothetical protein